MHHPRRARLGAAALLTLPLAACSQSPGAVDTDDAVETTDQDRTEPEAGLDRESLTVQAVRDDLDELVGEEVSVIASVDRVLGDRLLTLEPLAGSAEPLAVVGVRDQERLEEATPVRVTGVLLADFDAAEVARTTRVTVPRSDRDELDGLPYLLVTHLDTEPSAEEVDEAGAETDGEKDGETDGEPAGS